MNKTRIQIAKADIIKFFDQHPQKVFRRADVAKLLEEKREFWRLAQSTSTQNFTEFLIDQTKLREIQFPFPRPYRKEVRYTWGDVSIYEVMLSLKPGCYFSHYTAMGFHGLTEQIPKTIYLNAEQLNSGPANSALTQKAIEIAMKRPARTTGNVTEVGDFRITIISGKNTGNLGVVEEPVTGVNGASLGRLRFTRLERTLIDIAVRPVYSGGVAEVAKAFRRAKDKVSVNTLAALLQKLAYVYPYHQVIGFYLERADYKMSQIDLVRRFSIEFDFYLTHGMKDMDYVKSWRLYIPKGF